MSDSEPEVSVVVVAFGDEPLLGEALRAIRASHGVVVELIVVDNGYTGAQRDALIEMCDEWIDAGGNVGFALAVNIAAGRCHAPFVALINSDAVVDPGALAELAARAADPSIGAVQGQVLLYDEPDTVNTVGNPVHYSLMSWAGGWGESSARYSDPSDVPVASGCLMMIRSEVLARLGGMHGALFAYGEDVDLSLRAWQAGYRVSYCPKARVWHHYDFYRTGHKLFLLERSRLVNLLTLFEGRTLLRLGPGLLLVEVGVWVSALRDGWLRQKLSATRWLVAHRQELRERRRWVQQRRVVPDADLMAIFSPRITPSSRTGVSVPRVVNDVLAFLGRLGGVPVPAERVSDPSGAHPHLVSVPRPRGGYRPVLAPRPAGLRRRKRGQRTPRSLRAGGSAQRRS